MTTSTNITDASDETTAAIDFIENIQMNASPVASDDVVAEFSGLAAPTYIRKDALLTPPGTIPAPGYHPAISGGIRYSTLPHFEGLEMPGYGSIGASGFDIMSANYEDIYLNSIGSTAKIPTGIMLEVPPGFEAQVRPRSGLAAKHGITVTNTPGTIDADYRGEISILLTNQKGKRFTVERGMKIAQIVICPVVQTDLVFAKDLEDTDRGEGAFGSTGV